MIWLSQQCPIEDPLFDIITIMFCFSPNSSSLITIHHPSQSRLTPLRRSQGCPRSCQWRSGWLSSEDYCLLSVVFFKSRILFSIKSVFLFQVRILFSIKWGLFSIKRKLFSIKWKLFSTKWGFFYLASIEDFKWASPSYRWHTIQKSVQGHEVLKLNSAFGLSHL